MLCAVGCHLRCSCCRVRSARACARLYRASYLPPRALRGAHILVTREVAHAAGCCERGVRERACAAAEGRCKRACLLTHNLLPPGRRPAPCNYSPLATNLGSIHGAQLCRRWPAWSLLRSRLLHPHRVCFLCASVPILAHGLSENREHANLRPSIRCHGRLYCRFVLITSCVSVGVSSKRTRFDETCAGGARRRSLATRGRGRVRESWPRLHPRIHTPTDTRYSTVPVRARFVLGSSASCHARGYMLHAACLHADCVQRSFIDCAAASRLALANPTQYVSQR